MTKEIEYQSSSEKIENAVAKLLINSNYWGFLFGKIRRIPNAELPSVMGVVASQKKVGTIELHYNPDIVDKTDEKNLIKVLEHEGMHLLNQHIPRLIRIISVEQDPNKKYMKSKIWNIASDCAVNYQARIPRRLEIGGEKISVCYPDSYQLENNKTSESYYYSLYEEDDLKCPLCENEGDAKFIDDHQGWKAPKGEEEDYAREIEGQIKKIANEAKKNVNKSRGIIPGYLEEILEDLLGQPKIPYYQMIRKLVVGSRLSKYKTAYNRMNNKLGHLYFLNNIETDILPFPGKLKDKTFNIVIMLDTSASQSLDDISEALSGIKDIIENDKECFVTVIECDAKINKEYKINSIDDIDFNISGRGGTNLKPGLERARELNPDVSIVFTDGYCENINNFSRIQLPRKRIIWVIGPDGSDENLDQTGIVIWVDKDD